MGMLTDLKNCVAGLLEKSGYATCQYHGCFDIAAKKHLLLFLKVLQNVDAFQQEQAKNLKIISANLKASSLLIGLQTRKEKLKRGIVYERFGVPTIALDTLEDLICWENFPRIYSDRGGLYVEIDSALLRELRKKKRLTQQELAEAVGISKKAVYEHEKKRLRMLLTVAENLERVIEKKIIKDIEVFDIMYCERGKPIDSIEKSVEKDFCKLGFETDFVKQAPFDMFAKEKVLILSDIETDNRKMQKRVVVLKKFVSVAEKPAIVITEFSESRELEGIPVLRRKELKEFENKKDLIKLVKKR